MTIPQERSDSRFPRQASASRQVLQLIVALAGWVVFVYWWWLVFGRVSRREIVFTGWFIAITAAIAILVTSLWSLHNKRIHRTQPARSQVRAVRANYARDTLLRTVSFVGGEERVRTAPLLRILVGENKKTYRPEPGSGPGRGLEPAREPVDTRPERERATERA